ncbi:MAG: hypothetical protein NPIRA05_02700 [Nitrospirales bacterium]|nr:MAG: hypothetical protein NPIRA05_02700 [Nitrospirales bacterium]
MTYVLVMIVMLFLFSIEGYAEVRVNGQNVTVNLSRASLAKVMRQIGQEMGIHIDIVNSAEYNNAVISAFFEDVPLEQSLDHLLNGWNYGLSKDPKTGNVRTLMIVSHRLSVGNTNAHSVPASIVSNGLVRQDVDQDLEEEGVPDFVDEGPHRTDEDLLNDAPPEVRELISQMQKRDGEE